MHTAALTETVLSDSVRCCLTGSVSWREISPYSIIFRGLQLENFHENFDRRLAKLSESMFSELV